MMGLIYLCGIYISYRCVAYILSSHNGVYILVGHIYKSASHIGFIFLPHI